jgi:hypothetical protein
MRRRVPLFMAVDRTVFSAGLQPDLHPMHRTLWNAAANVTFFAGRVRRRLAAGLMFAAVSTDVIRGLSQQQATNGTRWLWSADASMNVWRWYGPTPEKIADATKLTGAKRDQTSTAPATTVGFTHYGDWTIINNGVAAPLIHKPSSGVTVYGDCPTGAAKLMKFRNFVLALGYSERGTRVGWSDADNVESWTATTENLAGSLTVDDFNTRIKAAETLGAAIAVYAEDQMALINYLGAPAVFGFKFALDGIGACGVMAVCGDGKQHYGVGRGGVWTTDGLGYKYIDEGYLHDYLQDHVNWDQQSKIVAARNDYTGCFEFSFPMLLSGSLECTEAWSFDPRTGGWSPIPAFSAKDERRLFGKPIVGGSTGRVMLDQNDPNAPAPLMLRTKPMLMQTADDSMGYSNLHVDSKIDEVTLLVTEATAVQFRLGSAQNVDGPFDWSPWMDVLVGSGTYDIGSSPADGVYFLLDFRSTEVNWALNLQGFMLFGQGEGTSRDASKS